MSYQNALVLQDLPELTPTRVKIDETEMILIRDGDSVNAFQATCPHAGAPLEEGAICEGRLICPWHKASFTIDGGEMREPLALRDLQRYPVRVVNGMVQVEPEPLKSPVFSQGDNPVIVILGSGAAGSAAAWTLRREGFSGRLVIVDREKQAPYDRTALSKFVPSGDMAIENVPSLLDGDFWRYAERHTGDVEELNTRQKWLRFADGQKLHYDQLLIASGGVPQRADISGKALKGVHVLRSLEQAATLLAEVEERGSVAIVGNSFIAMELAAALRAQDITVDVIAPHPLPFKAQFGERLAKHFYQLHQKNGVNFHVAEVKQLQGHGGHVTGVELTTGETIGASVVVLATGIKPATPFIHDIVTQDDGSLATDRQLKVAEQVWAAGDIASFPDANGLKRIEHWRVAQQQGRTAAFNMLGRPHSFHSVPFFWTAHYGTRYEYLGHASEWDEERLFGSLEAQDFILLYGSKGVLLAVASCGRYTLTAELVQRMQHRMTLDEAQTLVEQRQ